MPDESSGSARCYHVLVACLFRFATEIFEEESLVRISSRGKRVLYKNPRLPDYEEPRCRSNVKRGVHLIEQQPSKVRLPRRNSNEIFGTVEKMLGGSRITVRSQDGKTRMGRIPGKMKRRVWLRVGDVIIIRPWSIQDEKADVVWRYLPPQADWLRRKGYI